MTLRWPWLRFSVSLSETRSADTGGGDYAEGDIDKRSVDSPVETNADVTGSAVVGSNSGNVANAHATFQSGGGGGSATVTVNLDRLVEEPPQTIRDYIKSLWLLNLADQLERRERQAETDARQAEAERHRARVMIWLWLLSVLLFIIAIILAALLWQWVQRFGWFW